MQAYIKQIFWALKPGGEAFFIEFRVLIATFHHPLKSSPKSGKKQCGQMTGKLVCWIVSCKMQGFKGLPIYNRLPGPRRILVVLHQEFSDPCCRIQSSFAGREQGTAKGWDQWFYKDVEPESCKYRVSISCGVLTYMAYHILIGNTLTGDRYWVIAKKPHVIMEDNKNKKYIGIGELFLRID